MRIATFAVFVLCAVAPAQTWAQSATPAKACLRQDMVRGWNVVDDKTLIVTDRVGKRFRLALKPGCYDLKFNLRLGFKAFGGIGLTCLGRNDYVLVPPGGGQPAQRCFVADIQAYDAAMPPTGAAAPSQ